MLTGTNAVLQLQSEDYDAIDLELPLAPRVTPEWRLDVQVRLGKSWSDPWHRRAVVFGFTACGQEATYKHAVETRHESYDGQLCDEGCFSAWELELAAANNEKKEK